MQRLSIDLLRLTVDGTSHVAVAHVVLRRSWWRGRIVALMNADHIGTWNLAPRAHPNDGRFDIVEVAPAMSVRHRIQAFRRLPNGNHVPHPAITTSAVAAATWAFDPPMKLWIDGVRCGTVRHLEAHIEPDAFAIHV
jgi:diacylglycerol kinase family enzyme